VVGSFDLLSTFLLSNWIGILGLSETFISDSNSYLIGISGYRVDIKNRTLSPEDPGSSPIVAGYLVWDGGGGQWCDSVSSARVA